MRIKLDFDLCMNANYSRDEICGIVNIHADVLTFLFVSVRGHIRKGMALMALKEHSKASAAFQKALDLDPNNQVINLFLLYLSNLLMCMC